MDLDLLTNFVVYGLTLVYAIFMLLFLNNVSKYDDTMSDRDRNFRKAAVVITWIQVILGGFVTLAFLLSLIAGPQDKYRVSL